MAHGDNPNERLILAYRLPMEEVEGRIDCFGEFDRDDRTCLAHCGLNFYCAAARERYQYLQIHDETLQTLEFPHNA